MMALFGFLVALKNSIATSWDGKSAPLSVCFMCYVLFAPSPTLPSQLMSSQESPHPLAANAFPPIPGLGQVWLLLAHPPTLGACYVDVPPTPSLFPIMYYVILFFNLILMLTFFSPSPQPLSVGDLFWYTSFSEDFVWP